jgi:hypothetical protein
MPPRGPQGSKEHQQDMLMRYIMNWSKRTGTRYTESGLVDLGKASAPASNDGI